MAGARESIALTVEEIKDRVEGQYETVKATVEGVLDWREQLQRDPILWSVGALSAGFALGYTFGYAHNRANAPKRSSAMTVFTDTLVAQLGAPAARSPARRSTRVCRNCLASIFLRSCKKSAMGTRNAGQRRRQHHGHDERQKHAVRGNSKRRIVWA